MTQEPSWTTAAAIHARKAWSHHPGLEAWLGADYLPRRVAVLPHAVSPLFHYLVGTYRRVYPEALLSALEGVVTDLLQRYPAAMHMKAQKIAQNDGPQERREWWSTMSELCICSLMDATLSSSGWTLREGDGPDALLKDSVWLEVTRLEWPFLELLRERLGRNEHWAGWRLTLTGTPTSLHEVDQIGQVVERKLRTLQPQGSGFRWQIGPVTITGKYVGYSYFQVAPVNVPSVVASAPTLERKLRKKAAQANGQHPYVVAVDVSDVWDQLNVDDLWHVAETVSISKKVDGWYPFIRSMAPLSVTVGQWYFNDATPDGSDRATRALLRRALPDRLMVAGPWDLP